MKKTVIWTIRKLLALAAALATLQLRLSRGMRGPARTTETVDRKFIIFALNPCNGKFYTEKNALLLCAKDKAVPAALRRYRSKCVSLAVDNEHIESIGLLIDRVKRYQETVESHIPDTTSSCEVDRCIGGIGV